MKYSIVIVTYNRCDLLKECITCALQQTIAAGVAGFQAELEHYMKLFGSENRW